MFTSLGRGLGVGLDNGKIPLISLSYLLETQLLHRSNQIQIERGIWPTVASLTQLVFTVVDVVSDVDIAVVPSIPLLDTSCNTVNLRHLLSRQWVRGIQCVTRISPILPHEGTTLKLSHG